MGWRLLAWNCLIHVWECVINQVEQIKLLRPLYYILSIQRFQNIWSLKIRLETVLSLQQSAIVLYSKESAVRKSRWMLNWNSMLHSILLIHLQSHSSLFLTWFPMCLFSHSTFCIWQFKSFLGIESTIAHLHVVFRWITWNHFICILIAKFPYVAFWPHVSWTSILNNFLDISWHKLIQWIYLRGRFADLRIYKV